jgi:arsenate reductase
MALILMFGPISGAHFNPLVTMASCVLDSRPWRELAPYAFFQAAGGIGGAAVANAMFGLGVLDTSTRVRDGGGVWLGELVATVGLLLVILLVSRGPRPGAVPVAVGVWIGGAYWFSSSTSLANPAVTIARSLSDSFTGIAPASVPAFLFLQILGACVAVPLARYLTPQSTSSTPSRSTS